MELRHLEAFVAVAREGTFTEAARRLNLTQPSLSARIRQLEQDLDGTLFTRHVRPVELTESGRVFLPYAERILGVLEAGQEAVQIAQSGFTGRLAVGCPVSVSTYLMPEVIDQFSQAFPHADLFLETSHSTNLVEALLDGVLDIAFTAVLPQLIKQADIIIRVKDDMVVAVHERHSLANQPIVQVEELWQYRQILPRWGDSFEAYIRSLRDLVSHPKPMVRVPLAAGLPMLTLTDTVTFIPRRLAQATGLITLHVPQISFPWDVVLITRPGRSLTPLEQSFVHFVAEAIDRNS